MKFVCPRTFVNNARTAGPIVTGEAPFDSPIRWNNDGADLTPNSVHGCTLARPTWRCMKKGAGVHCARAVHVQMFCTCSSFAAPTGHTVRAADANLQVTCMLVTCTLARPTWRRMI